MMEELASGWIFMGQPQSSVDHDNPRQSSPNANGWYPHQLATGCPVHGEQDHLEHDEDDYRYRYDSEDEEKGPDMYGQRHVETTNGADRPYVIGFPEAGSLRCFSNPVEESELAMREYLLASLPSPQYFWDEYGDADELDAISSRHVARLHAQLWDETPRISAPTVKGEDRIPHGDLALSSIMIITNALSSNYVFVRRNRGPTSPCLFDACGDFHKESHRPWGPHSISLEPLVDWATLDRPTGMDEILIFRRNKKLLFKYTLDITGFLPKHPITFCFECLNFLWTNRKGAWACSEQLPVDYRHQIEAGRRQYEMTGKGLMLGRGGCEESDDTESSNSDQNSSLDESSWGAPTGDMQTTPEYEKIRDVSLGLDGTCDPKPDPKPRHRSAFKIWEDSGDAKPCENTTHCLGASTPTPRFTPVGRRATSVNNVTAPSGLIKSRGWTATRTISSTTVAPAGDAAAQQPEVVHQEGRKRQLSIQSMDRHPRKFVFSDDIRFSGTFDKSEEETYPNSRAGIPTGPPQDYQFKPGITFKAPPMEDFGPIGSGRPGQAPLELKDSGIPRVEVFNQDRCATGASTLPQERQFGREVPVNRNMAFEWKIPYIVNASPRNEQPSQRMTPTTPAKPTAYHRQQPRFSESRMIIPTMELPETPSDPIADRLSNLGLNAHPVREQPFFGSMALTTPAINFRESSSQRPGTLLNQQGRLITPPNSKGKGGSKVDARPINAQPWPPMQNVAPGKDAEYVIPPKKRFPSPDNVICVCQTKAQTFKVKIVECWNPDCLIGWYHYDCLNKYGKLSSLRGKWLCHMCKDAAEYPKRRGDAMTDFTNPFSRKEIQDLWALPETVTPVVNPYGLGMQRHTPATPHLGLDDHIVPDVQDMPKSAPPPTADRPQSHSGDAYKDPYGDKSAPAQMPTPGAMQAPSYSLGTDQDGKPKIYTSDQDPQLKPVGTLAQFGYATSSPYWLSRVYGGDPSHYADEFNALYDAQFYGDEEDGWYDEEYMEYEDEEVLSGGQAYDGWMIPRPEYG